MGESEPFFFPDLIWIMARHPYAWRTWRRRRLPWVLIKYGLRGQVEGLRKRRRRASLVLVGHVVAGRRGSLGFAVAFPALAVGAYLTLAGLPAMTGWPIFCVFALSLFIPCVIGGGALSSSYQSE